MTNQEDTEIYTRPLENPQISQLYGQVLAEIGKAYNSDDIFIHDSLEGPQKELRFHEVRGSKIILRETGKNHEVTLDLDEFLRLFPVSPQRRENESQLVQGLNDKPENIDKKY